ncbi:MAG: ATP-binding protein [Ardenticatenales bacterium]|nr:ATP-binding protein [Ardenticatenales bacterium]
MEEQSKQPFKLHMPGLLKVLAEHLYSNKQVAIRELIQNAHDSCMRRSVEEENQFYRPRIDLAIDRAERVLRISDNGSGLSAEDISDYLSTIGRSYTRELREMLSILSQEEAYQLIGQFGFGFLSAFLIAEEVTVITKSHQPGSEALRWHSTGDEYYEVTPATRREVGSTIELKIKPSAAFVLQPQLLQESARRFADFLPIPIYLDGDPVPVNLTTPPWEASDPQRATLDYIERAFNIEDPICILPLHEQVTDLGHDTVELPIKGFLFVPPDSTVSVREYGDVKVFIRKMFICDDERELLPPWARFVRGVIDCPALQPTASREALHQDETYALVRDAIEQQLIALLRRLARDEPDTWKQIVLGHSDIITSWAAKNNDFFEQVADLLPVRTSRGKLTLPDYLQLTGGTIYYTTRELGSLQDKLLAEGHDVPVVEAAWFGVEPFLHRYAQRHLSVGLVPMDGDAKNLMRPVPEESYQTLLDAYRELGVRAKIVAFKPMEVPAMMIYPKNADFIIETRDALERDELPGPLAGLVSDYMQNRMQVSAEELKGTLYLNASCPLIRQFSEMTFDDAKNKAALTLIHQIARLFAGRTLTPADVAGAFRTTTTAIEELLP